MASIARITLIRRSRPFARAAGGALDVDPSEEDEQDDEDGEPEDRTHGFLSVIEDWGTRAMRAAQRAPVESQWTPSQCASAVNASLRQGPSLGEFG
jgi:hypothetical protein